MYFYAFFVLIFRGRKYICVDSYVFCMSDYLLPDTILQSFSIERGFLFQKKFPILRHKREYGKDTGSVCY